MYSTLNKQYLFLQTRRIQCQKLWRFDFFWYYCKVRSVIKLFIELKKNTFPPNPPPTPQTHKDKQKQTRIHENLKELNTLIERDLNVSCIVTIAIPTFHKMKTKLVLLWYVFPELDYMFIFQCHWIYSHYKSI